MKFCRKNGGDNCAVTDINENNMANRLISYLQAKGNKAMAISMVNGALGFASGFNSEKSAISGALDNCSDNGGYDCELKLIGNRKPELAVDLSPPESPRKPELTLSSSGTGFYVNPNHFVTNEHVISSCDKISISKNGQSRGIAYVSASEPDLDLAILRTNIATTGFLKVAGKTVIKGSDVWTYGYPLGSLLSKEAKISAGIVNSTSGVENDFKYLQISIPIQPGNSGGAVISRFGEVVGVATSTLSTVEMANLTGASPQNLNFAVKASVLNLFLEERDIEFSISNNAIPLNPIQLAELAEEATVQVLCWVYE